MGHRTHRIRATVLGATAGTLVFGATALGILSTPVAADTDAAVGCTSADEAIVVDLWALYGRQAPLLGDPEWGETSRTHALPTPLPPGRYQVYGISENNLSDGGQVHEQWAVEIGGVRSAFMPDIPDDAVWYAAFPGLFLTAFLLAISFISDALADVFDPRRQLLGVRA